MPVADEPRSTVAAHWRTVLRETAEVIRYSANVILGCLCYTLLLMMGLCFPRDAKKDEKSVRAPVTQASSDEAVQCDLESQGRLPWTSDESWKNSTERTRTNGQQSHVAEDERLSIIERHDDTGKYHVISKPPSEDLARHHDGEDQPEDTREEAECPSDPDGSEHSNDHMTDTVAVSMLASQTQSETDVMPDTPDVNDLQTASSKPFLFENETEQRFFLEKADACSEKEIIVWCRSLNSRINNLSAHLLREKNRIRGPQTTTSSSRRLNIQDYKSGGENKLAELVRRALGSRLCEEIVDACTKGEPSSELDASIQDGLDAWSVFCVHLAMKPMLFGLKLRTVDEVEEIFRQMADHEPELARCWIRIRSDDPPRSVDPRIQALARDICPLTEPQLKDLEEYCLLEEIYRRDFVSEHRRQIALHWRGLLHKYELWLASYNEAMLQTERIISQGLLEVFAIAGVELPPTFASGLRDFIDKIVKDASKLAELTKTSSFSQSIEVVTVEPGGSFDEETMRVADEGDAGNVKCTIQLGLHAIDSAGERTILLMPEVILA